MKTWNVYAIIGASKFLGTVQAETKEDAGNKAWEELEIDCPILCWQCAREVDMGDVHSLEIEENDGTATQEDPE